MTVQPRNTRQRTAISQFTARQQSFLTAQQIHDGLRNEGERISLTTVYRTLATLAEGGQLDSLRTPDGEVAYRPCPQQSGHHHHLICRVCGHTIEVHGSKIEKWLEDLCKQHGFTDVAHDLEFFGLCATCTAQQ